MRIECPACGEFTNVLKVEQKKGVCLCGHCFSTFEIEPPHTIRQRRRFASGRRAAKIYNFGWPGGNRYA